MTELMNNLVFPGILAILSAILGYIVWLLKDNKKINDANAKGTMLLLRREIINDHRRFVINGEHMEPFDFSDLNDVHEAYKALGGNGLTDKMFEELENKQFTS